MAKLTLFLLSLFLLGFPASLLAHSPDDAAARVAAATAHQDRAAQDSTISLLGARNKYAGSAHHANTPCKNHSPSSMP
jgi:hypothetical protein